MSWFKSMQKYSMKGSRNVDQLTKNIDLELIPKIVEKIVLDKIDRKSMLKFIFEFLQKFRIFRNGCEPV